MEGVRVELLGFVNGTRGFIEVQALDSNFHGCKGGSVDSIIGRLGI